MTPTCHGCQRLSREWVQLVEEAEIKALPVKFAFLNIETPENQEILEDYMGDKQISYTPTVMLYGADKMNPSEYTGDYKRHSLKSFIVNYCNEHHFGVSKPERK